METELSNENLMELKTMKVAEEIEAEAKMRQLKSHNASAARRW
jgi:hypothetical protein